MCQIMLTHYPCIGKILRPMIVNNSRQMAGEKFMANPDHSSQDNRAVVIGAAASVGAGSSDAAGRKGLFCHRIRQA